jgi:hypothetical protein
MTVSPGPQGMGTLSPMRFARAWHLRRRIACRSRALAGVYRTDRPQSWGKERSVPDRRGDGIAASTTLVVRHCLRRDAAANR